MPSDPPATALGALGEPGEPGEAGEAADGRRVASYRAPRSGRGRRPSAQVRAEVLVAADQLLREVGMAGFTIEGVAARAGASKMTIYKWWPSKGVLALEAYAAAVDGDFAVPDTGDLEADLTAQLTRFARALAGTSAGRVTAGLVGAAQTDPELADAFRRIYLLPRRAAGLAVLRAARTRGELRADVDLEVLSDQLWGACMYRLLMGHRPLTEGFVRALLDNLLAGVRPSATPSS